MKLFSKYNKALLPAGDTSNAALDEYVVTIVIGITKNKSSVFVNFENYIFVLNQIALN